MRHPVDPLNETAHGLPQAQILPMGTTSGHPQVDTRSAGRSLPLGILNLVEILRQPLTPAALADQADLPRLR